MLIFKARVNLPKHKLLAILLAVVAPLKCHHIKLANGIKILGNFKEVEWGFFYSIMATGYELIIEPISETTSLLKVIGETNFSPLSPPKYPQINVDDTLMPIIGELKPYIIVKSFNKILFIILLILSIPSIWVIYEMILIGAYIN